MQSKVLRECRELWSGAGLLTAIMLVASPLQAAVEFPELTGRVVDEAELLSSSEAGRLSDLLEQHEDRTGNQVVVVTVTSLRGQSIEDFGRALGNYWGIGQADEDNGVLLVVAPVERKVRIEVGAGLDHALTDSRAQAIIERRILPMFREEDYARGIVNGAGAILGVLDGIYDPVTRPVTPTAPTRTVSDDTNWPMLLILLGVIGIIFLFKLAGGSNGGIHFTSGGGSAGSSHFSGDGGGFDGGGGDFDGGGASGDW